MADEDYKVTLTLASGRNVKFVIPKDKVNEYFEGGDKTKPIEQKLRAVGEEAFPDVFRQNRSVESASRYYQGPGEVKLTGATKPATPSEPRPRIPKPAAPKPAPQLPRQATQTGFGPVANVPQGNPKTVSEYISRFLANTDTGTPARIAREYWASPNKESFDFKGLSPLGIKAIKQYTQEAAITREAENAVTPLQIQAYRQEFLDPDARRPEALPARILQEYRLSPNRATFRFPAKFSAEGRAAIRAVVAEEDEARRLERESSEQELKRLRETQRGLPREATQSMFGPVSYTPSEAAAGVNLIKQADVKTTAALTGQKPSEAPAFGLFPYAISDPSRGIIPSAVKTVAELGKPSTMAAVAAATPAVMTGGLGLAAIPTIGGTLATLGGLTAGAVPVAQSLGRASVTGDYREAIGTGIANLGLEALLGAGYLGRGGVTSLRGALLNRMARRAGQIQDIEGRMAPGAVPPGMGATSGATGIPVRQARKPEGYLPTQAEVTGIEPVPGLPPLPLRTTGEVVAEEGGVATRNLGIITRPDVRESVAPIPPPTMSPEQVAVVTRLADLQRQRQFAESIGATPPKSILDEIASLEASLAQSPEGRALLGLEEPLNQRPLELAKPESPVIGTRARQPEPEAIEFPVVTPKRPSAVGTVDPAVEQVRRANLQAELDAIRAEKARLFNQTQRVPIELIQREAQIVNDLKAIDAATGGGANAVQVEGTGAGVPRTGQPEVGLPKVGEGDQVPGQTARAGQSEVAPGVTPQAEVTPPGAGAAGAATAGRAAASATPDQATLVDEVSGVLNEAAGIKQKLQRDEAISLGLADQTPKQGSVSSVLRRDIENAVADPELRNAYIDQIKNTNWNDPAQVGNLSTGHQTAAFIRQRELTPLLNDPDPTIRRAAINEWTQMHQAIYKIGSKKGFDLAMQKLFNITVDFSSPDVQNDLMAYITATMRNSGATDAQIDAAIARILPRAEQGRVTYGQVNTQVNNAANVADEVLQNARAAGRKMTDAEIMAEYQRRLALLDQTTLPKWAGKSSPLVSVAVREFRNGVRKLEDVKARIKDMYGDDIPDDVLNDIMRKARIEFEADNKKVDAVIGAINKDVSDEVWKTYSRGRKALERLRSVQNFERLIVLGLDLGIFGVQFGLAGATRPALMFAQMPSGKRTGVERAAAMTVGGIPSPRAAFSGDKGGGIVPATIKAFGTERGALAAEEDIATLARTRYPEFDDPFADAGLMGFRDGDVRGAGLTRELSFDTQRAIESLPAPMRKLYQSSQRGTETGLRYGRALIFDQMMGSFENLPKDQKLQAMQAVASFVNTLTGGGTYGQGVEAALKLLGNLQTAPRYYTSNIEMASLVSPFARTMYAGRQLPGKEVAKLAGLVGAEYGRMATTMLMLKYMLAPLGGEVVADPYDQDFGTVRLKLTDGSEETISVLAGREKYVPLLLTTVKGKKRQRVVSGGPSMWENLSVSDRLDMVGNVLYGKSTVIPRNLVGLIPAKRPPETAMEAPSVSSYLRSEFRSPGGQAFVPAQAMNDPLKSLLYIGERVVPAPLFAKQLAQNLPYYIGEGSTEKGKRILALARTANALLSNVGVQANVKMTPEMVQRITSGAPMQEADIQRLPPAERERYRMSLMTTGNTPVKRD